MAAVMSPILVGVPSLKTGGVVNSGGLLYTYLAGTTTAAATYPDSTLSGANVNANPMVFNSLGLLSTEIWWAAGTYFKFIIKDSAGNTIAPTYDNLVGINDGAGVTATEWTVLALTPTYISPTSFSVTGDQTITLHVGRRLKTLNTSGTVYNTMVSSVFAAGVTTIKVDSATLDAGMSTISYGLLSATNPSLPVIFPEGLKNKLLNGDFRVSQRIGSAVQSYGAATPLLYSVDQWYGYCTGADVTGAQVITSSPDKSAYRFTGAVGVTSIGLGQRIEKLNSLETSGQTVSLSVVLANSLLTQVGWSVYVANTTNAFGTLAAPTRSLVATGTFAVTSTLKKNAVAIAIPAGNYTGVEVVFTVGAQVSGTWTISEAQLELGPTATNFEYRPYSLEEMLCQRYYESGVYSFTLPLSNVSIVGSYLTHVDFKVTKFAVPVIVGTQDQGGAFATASLTVDSGLFGRSDIIALRSNTGTWTASALIP